MRTISAVLVVLLLGLSASASMLVSAENHAPVANAGPDKKTGVSDTVQFDGSGSSDPDEDELNYTWDFDDSDGLTAEATGVTASHVYSGEGTFKVTLTVSDGNLSDTDTATVTVSEDHVNQAPTAVISEPQDLSRYNTTANITFSGEGSTDPDGDLLTYKWDFGDNEKANGMVVVHQYESAGVYTVALNVSDGQLSSEATITVLIEGRPSGPGGPPPIPGLPPMGRPIIDTGGPYTGMAWLMLQLDASRTKAANGQTLEFCWDLNQRDGIQAQWCFDAEAAKTHYWQIAYGRGPVVSYQEPGNYTLTLIVRQEGAVAGDKFYWYNTSTTSATISEHDTFGVDAGKDKDIKSGEKTTLSGKVWMYSQYYPEWVIRCEWDFDNDGTTDMRLDFDRSEKLKTANCPAVHTYTVNGTVKNDTIFTSRLQGAIEGELALDPASDATSNGPLLVYYQISKNDTINLTVPAPPNLLPIATCNADKIGDNAAFVGEETVFTMDAVDPDDDRIILYEWDFNGDGVTDYSNPASGNTVYGYNSPGSFTAIGNVTDSRKGSGMCWVNVTVRANNLPLAVISGPDSGKAGEELDFDGSGSTDEDGPDEIVAYYWDFDASDGLQEEATGEYVTHMYTKGGTYTVTLRVRDKHDGTSEATMDVAISQTYGATLELSGASSAEVEPGKSQAFTLKLTNSGNGNDCYDLQKSGTKTTWGELSSNEVCLKAAESRTLTLRVTVPSSSEAGDEASIKIEAVSQGSSDIKDDITVRVSAQQSYGLTLHMEETKAEIKAGEAKSLSLRITNTGNGKDTFKFTADGTDKAWVAFEKDSLSLEAGETKELTVKYIVPKDAKGGDHMLTLTAYSTGDNTDRTSIVTTITVKEKETGPVIPGFDAAVVLLALAVSFVVIGAIKGRKKEL